MHDLIRQADQKRQMAEMGYIKFPLLDSSGIEFCKQLFRKNASENMHSGFHVLMELNDFTQKLHVHEELRNLLEPELTKFLREFNGLMYSLQIKNPGKGSMLHVHQDWSITDEVNQRTYSLWVPLHDTYPENGGMFVIPGSHELLGNLRAPSLSPPYADIRDHVLQYMQPVLVKAGEALLFDQALLHYSPVNQTEKERISIISTLAPSHADLLRYYYNEEEDAMEGYEFEDLFWIKFNDFATERFQKPGTKQIVKIDNFSPKQLTKKEFDSKMKELNEGNKEHV